MDSKEKGKVGQKALLVIDVQQELFEKINPIYKIDDLLDNIDHLVKQAHQADSPVIYIQHSGKNSLILGSPGWQFHPHIKPQADELVIHKTVGNAFDGTNLHETLQKLNISTVVTCGLVTHGCVRATSLGALDLGYHVTLVSDAHSNFSNQPEQVIEELNQKMRAKRAAVIPTFEICFSG